MEGALTDADSADLDQEPVDPEGDELNQPVHGSENQTRRPIVKNDSKYGVDR